MIAFAQHVFIYVIPFLFVLTLVVTVHELGHFTVARALGVSVDRFSIGFGRPIVQWTDRWGVAWQIGWIPLGGYVKFSGDADASSSVPDAEKLAELRREIALHEGVGAERRYFHFKPVWVRALVVAAGPAANFVLAIVLFAVLLGAIGEAGLRPRISAVEPGSPAAAAGFRAGDLVTKIGGEPVTDFRDIIQFVQLRTGDPMRVDIQRGPKAMSLVVTPVRKSVPTGIGGATAQVGYLGLVGSTNRADVFQRRFAPLPAVQEAVRLTWSRITTTSFYLSRILRGKESGDQLGGPLRIAAMADAAAKAGAAGATDLKGALLGGLVALLSLTALLSVGVGFMNLLPIPVLDGGHLVFYAYEAVVRRPMASAVQSAGYRVGLALLFGFMLFATWNDLQQLRVFKFIGGLFS
jgi:regulator of sigma E protease